MTMKKAPSSKKPPLIIEQIGEEFRGDVTKTGHVLAKLFFGAWASGRGTPASSQEEVPTKSKRFPPARVVITQQGRGSPLARSKATPSSASSIQDAEVLEEEGPLEIFTNCSTCGGSGILGRPGYELLCPVCQPKREPSSW